MSEGIFLAICRDRDDVDAMALRRSLGDRHLRHADAIGKDVRLGGIALSEDRGRIVASVVVIAAPDAAAARAIIELDPFWTNGVWGSIDVSPFFAATGSWIGGWSPELPELLAALA